VLADDFEIERVDVANVDGDRLAACPQMAATRVEPVD
jgi:hypothetical protein